VPLERSFLSTSFLHNRVRNRLTAANTDLIAFIFINSRALKRLKELRSTGIATVEVPGKRWSTVMPAVLVEIEDKYQVLFRDPLSEDNLARLLALEDDEEEDELEAFMSETL